MGAFWDNWSQYFRSIVCPNRALYGKWWWEGEYYEWKQFNATTCYFHTVRCLFFALPMYFGFGKWLAAPSYQYLFLYLHLHLYFVFCAEVQLQDNGKGSAGTSYCCNLSLKKVENGQFPKVKTQLCNGRWERGKLVMFTFYQIFTLLWQNADFCPMVSSHMSK